ncbi:hypothetical protein [Sphingobium yanoikuyae]|uniref:Uncharacterized protein n=1 Tax=Sphingobium yanoikuyae TaxID=13690 RepID=A0A291MZV0_SPHYA|nr:hypothetical protein [Sphingobium yanoikuyae]ATI80632.1 hypothetical protein A6768_11935 [Sphingobium yanoikuyae]
MTMMTQAEIFEVLGQWSAPALVARPPLRQGGVDPLGLRQVNFDLMDRCIPGLNNTATRLRPYTLVAWAWWKAAALGKAEVGDMIDVDRLKAYVDRVEVLFAVGHLLEDDFAGLLGSDTLRGEVISQGSYDFSSKRWKSFRNRRKLTTSLMAPVSYGPSAKEGAGLGYLSVRADGAFAPTAEVMPAVLALDDMLAEILDDPCLARLDCGKVEVEHMRELHSYWSMVDLTEAEREIGRSRLLRGPRRQTLDLVQSVLRQADNPMDVAQIRQALAQLAPQAVPAGKEPDAASLWRAMQAQQLHRISLEALLVWLLGAAVNRPHHLTELADLLLEETDHDEGASFGQWQNALPAPDGQPCDPVPAIECLSQAKQRDNPGLALDGLRTALALCREMGSDPRLFGGAADRLPLALALTRAGRIANLPLRDGFEILLSEWVIGQHLYWAVGRSGDETQRLRLMLDEGGWLAFSSPANAAPTPDRLGTLLSLATDAGILHWEEADGYDVYAMP